MTFNEHKDNTLRYSIAFTGQIDSSSHTCHI